MSAVATPPRRGVQLALRPRTESLDLEHLRRERSRQPDGGRLTLEQLLDGVWEGLRAAGTADCPVCGSRMSPTRCGSCGSVLS